MVNRKNMLCIGNHNSIPSFASSDFWIHNLHVNIFQFWEGSQGRPNPSGPVHPPRTGKYWHSEMYSEIFRSKLGISFYVANAQIVIKFRRDTGKIVLYHLPPFMSPYRYITDTLYNVGTLFHPRNLKIFSKFSSLCITQMSVTM